MVTIEETDQSPEGRRARAQVYRGLDALIGIHLREGATFDAVEAEVTVRTMIMIQALLSDHEAQRIGEEMKHCQPLA